MTETTVTRPPQPAPPGDGLTWAAVPDETWRIAEGNPRCGDRRRRAGAACGRPAVAEADIGAGTGSFWPWRGYCPEHAATRLHWVQDGAVLKWEPRRDGTALTAVEAARVLTRVASTDEAMPWDRNGHSTRWRNDTWDAATTAGRRDAVTFITEATEARLGYVRCHRCREDKPAIPVEFGNLEGGTLDEWIALAVKQAEGQHPAHKPVKVGVVLADEMARLRAQVEAIQERMAPSVTPSPVPFRPAATR